MRQCEQRAAEGRASPNRKIKTRYGYMERTPPRSPSQPTSAPVHGSLLPLSGHVRARKQVDSSMHAVQPTK